MSTEAMVNKNQLSQSLENILKMIVNKLNENDRNLITNRTRLTNITNLTRQISTDIEKLKTYIDEEFLKIEMSITTAPIVFGGKGPATRYFIDQSTIGNLAKVDLSMAHLFGYAECIRCLAYTTDEEMTTILSTEFLEEKCIEGNIEPAMYNLTTGLRRAITSDYNLEMDKERTAITQDYLPNRVWLVNPITHKIYFHMFIGRYIDLSSLCDSNTGKLFVNGMWVNDIGTRW